MHIDLWKFVNVGLHAYQRQEEGTDYPKTGITRVVTDIYTHCKQECQYGKKTCLLMCS